jgi:hypothetical protein
MQRHPYEWPILAENHWPNHGRKLTARYTGIAEHFAATGK